MCPNTTFVLMTFVLTRHLSQHDICPNPTSVLSCPVRTSVQTCPNNKNSIINGTLWSSIRHMRKEDSTTATKWREDITTRQQNSPTIEETRGGRKIQQKEKILRLQNLIRLFSSTIESTMSLIISMTSLSTASE